LLSFKTVLRLYRLCSAFMERSSTKSGLADSI
jgi:hypothetical protein